MRTLIYLLISILGLAPAAFSEDGGLQPPHLTCNRATSDIVLDGSFEEDAWQNAEWFSDFRQGSPVYLKSPTEKTRVAFVNDEHNLYIAVQCLDSDVDRLVATTIRHRSNPRRDDHVEIVLDTYRDKVRGYLFCVNPLGAKEEGQINGARGYNWDWDETWQVETAISPDGWQAEFSIPLKILKFAAVDMQSWGVNVHRSIKRKREEVYIHAPPQPHDVSSLHYAASLTGIEKIHPDRNIQATPYALAGSSYTEDGVTEYSGNYGADMKYALTNDLTLDLTFNTDFAQVEADSEQVNLSRFSLFFPEKREFFLESAQLFNFGGGHSVMPFFSRRIGLADGEVVPIDAGARLTGKAAGWDIGLLSVRTGETVTDNGPVSEAGYNVVRLRRNIDGRSFIGGVVTDSRKGDFNSSTWGVDGSWWVTDELEMRGYYSRVEETGLKENSSWASVLDYTSSNVGLSASMQHIGEDYKPDLGFVRRGGVDNYRLRGRRTWRFEDSLMRSISTDGWASWYDGTQGPLESARHGGRINLDFDSGERIQLQVDRSYEFLDEAFVLSDGISFGRGEYTYERYRLEFNSNWSRRVRGHFQFSTGGYFSANRNDMSGSVGLTVNRHLALSAGLNNYSITSDTAELNWYIWSTNISYYHNANISLAGLMQYNSSTGTASANVRFRVLYGNDSDFFIVLNERRVDDFDRWALASRDAIIKVNYRITL